MSRFRRDRHAGEEQRATTLELFFDLVFVFAVTQVSHILLDDLSWRGGGADAARAGRRLVGVELHDVGHERARPGLDRRAPAAARADVREPADGGRDPGGVRRRARCCSPASYVAIQVGRHLFLTFVVGVGRDDRARARGADPDLAVRGRRLLARGRRSRTGTTRGVLWLIALAIDYGAPSVVYWVPGRPRARRTSRGTSRRRTSPSASSSSSSSRSASRS